MNKKQYGVAAVFAVGLAVGSDPAAAQRDRGEVLKGKAAFGDWRTDKPGVRRLITPKDLPPPGANAATQNFPKRTA
jgi:hypothetical protein